MSRAIDILSAIRSGATYDAPAMSRAEAILKSIANGTAYTDEPMSRMEELLLAIKNGATVSEAPQTRIEEILVAIANDTLDEWLLGKNLSDVNNYAKTKDEQVEIIDDVVIAKNVKNALYFKVVIKVGENYAVSFDLHSSITEASTGKWRLFYTDGTYSAIGSNGGYVLCEKEVAYLLIYANSGTASDATLEHLKLEQGTTATPYTPYAFESELEEAFIATADKLKGE